MTTMNTIVETLRETTNSANRGNPEFTYAPTVKPAHSEFDRFSEAGICQLVRQLFFPSAGKSPRQVVFSAIDEDTDVGGICFQAAEVLSAYLSANVAVIEANAFSRDTGRFTSDGKESQEANWARFGWLRSASDRLSLNLWRMPGPVFWTGGEAVGSPLWIHDRLSELRLEFDYTLLHAPPAGLYSGTTLLGQASDGVVLAIEAHRTRRSAAIKTKENLQASNVKVLGTVLSGRTFPIPEQIYKHI